MPQQNPPKIHQPTNTRRLNRNLMIMPLISTLLRVTTFKSPFLSTLAPSIGLAYAIQAGFAVPAILTQTERYYDLSGSLTYLSCTALSLYLPTLRARYAASQAGGPLPHFPDILATFSRAGGANAWNWRQVTLSAAVIIWATRLGAFLFQRVLKQGSDSRFDEIKKSPPQFFGAWMAQATWVSLCLLPVLALNSIPATSLAALPSVSITDVVGIVLYIGGLGFEATADRQKSQWLAEKKEKKHEEDFLTRGLWSKSRHPNYFGESTLWTGIATTSGGVLASKVGLAHLGLAGTAWGPLAAVGMAAISPAFVTFLLFKVSGIPLSEKKYDKRYGDRKDYQKWKAETPLFFPKL